MSTGYTNFCAVGKVAEINSGSIQTGTQYVEIVLLQRYDELAARAWGEVCSDETLQNVSVGDVVAITGTVRSRLGKNGWYNTSCSIRGVDILWSSSGGGNVIDGAAVASDEIPF